MLKFAFGQYELKNSGCTDTFCKAFYVEVLNLGQNTCDLCLIKSIKLN